jgi:hypothetical protein
MKLWNKINWPVVKAGHALKLKIEDNFWREWPAQDTLKEKGLITPLPQTDRTTVHALMVWTDDGGKAV